MWPLNGFRNGNYDILLLDFFMPSMFGDAVVKEVRKFNKDIFIILLTGHKSMAPPIRTIRDLDIHGYYEKSDKFDQLEILVESSLKSIRQIRTIRKNYIEMTMAIRKMVDAKDANTKDHSERVAFLAIIWPKKCPNQRISATAYDLPGCSTTLARLPYLTTFCFLKTNLLTCNMKS